MITITIIMNYTLMNFSKKLLTLKQKLTSAKNFNEPWEYFFHHFSDDPSFIDLGELTTNPTIKAMVVAVGEIVFNTKTVEIHQPFFTEIRRLNFIHGICFAEGCLVSLFYYTDIDMGLMAIAMPDGSVSLARLTSQLVSPNDDLHSFKGHLN